MLKTKWEFKHATPGQRELTPHFKGVRKANVWEFGEDKEELWLAARWRPMNRKQEMEQWLVNRNPTECTGKRKMWVKKNRKRDIFRNVLAGTLLSYLVTLSPRDKKKEFSYCQNLLLYTPDS